MCVYTYIIANYTLLSLYVYLYMNRNVLFVTWHYYDYRKVLHKDSFMIIIMIIIADVDISRNIFFQLTKILNVAPVLTALIAVMHPAIIY